MGPNQGVRSYEMSTFPTQQEMAEYGITAVITGKGDPVPTDHTIRYILWDGEITVSVKEI
jgi:hypothetical protein